ncbi:DUF6502 family protein [Thiomonas sp. FB-6]|uniref:DUF6502 family protein n=1 Tax=Thiomonas sp. FB-6 TaxID=1158291 RepID=UPI0012DFE651|nr:DUF6502 family protein [Thiomonas sp. FB-6]
MGRSTTPLPSSSPARPQPAQETLEAWMRVQAPLCRLLLDSGIDYKQAVLALKQVFLRQAQELMAGRGAPDTDSGLSVVSGVHRKDVHAWRNDPAAHARSRAPMSTSSQVFARWAVSAGYHDRRRRPKAVPRLGPAPSFEALVRACTSDVHPYSVLQEMVRIGLVEMALRKGVEYVVPRNDVFVPAGEPAQWLELFGLNLADHASTAVRNLGGEAPRLEQSVFADGLSQASMQRLGELSRDLWARAREAMVAEAIRCLESDAARPDANGRMRFGAYYWSEEQQPAPSAPAAPETPRAGRGARAGRRASLPRPPSSEDPS